MIMVCVCVLCICVVCVVYICDMWYGGWVGGVCGMWCVYVCYLGCSKMELCGFELHGCVIYLHKDFVLVLQAWVMQTFWIYCVVKNILC